MAELEQQLRLLAADLEWPPTPTLAVRRPSRRWPLVAALAAALAVGLAFAVPQSRGALLRFFHLGGVSIERVDTLPPASLRMSLGARVSRAEARRLLGRPFAVQIGPVYASGPAVSTLLPDDVVFSEANVGAGPEILKKYAGGATVVDFLQVGGAPALWIHGFRHVFLAPTLPPRYAGNTLVWQRGPITYRLEGKGLTRAGAVALAQRLLDSGD